jgi:glycosyltransferase involved in cell wall biosynthesis
MMCAHAVPYGERSKSFAYAGVISRMRSAVEMVEAFDALGDAEARLELAGEISPDLEDALRSLPGWKFVTFHGTLSRAAMTALLGRVRAGLILFYPLPNHVDAQPNKMFEYMSAGLPVIASDFPLWRAIVDGSKCGVLADPRDPRAIAEATARPGSRGTDMQLGCRGPEAHRSVRPAAGAGGTTGRMIRLYSVFPMNVRPGRRWRERATRFCR